MDELERITIDADVLAPRRPQTPDSEEGLAYRRKVLSALFLAYDCNDADRRMLYYQQTLDIPFRWLGKGVRRILDTHVWSRLPTIADVKIAAKTQAGMHRKQYRGGQYVDPPTSWPPEGMRYAIQAGEYEELRGATPLILPPMTTPFKIGTGED